MFTILRRKLKRSRKYPIKRDSYGSSARQQAFDAFDQGKRPAEVATIVPISKRTADRYFAYWKNLPKNLDRKYRVGKAILKNDGEFSRPIVESLADTLGMREEEVIERLSRPWGIKQLIMGKWPNYAKDKRQSVYESRLQAALWFVLILERSEMPPETITAELLKIREKVRKSKGHE